MHVQCESCATQYEFDDALVSGRGTTVKCSNCGYQFKVRKAGGEDQWLVTTADGSTFVYGSLRELQRAIMSRQIHASDLLERGGVAPRPIGQIAELAPFFDEKRRPTSAPPGGAAPNTVRSAPPEPAPVPEPVPIHAGRLDPDRTAATPARLLAEHLAASRTPVPPPPEILPVVTPIASAPAVAGAGSAVSGLASTFGAAPPVRSRIATEPDFLTSVPSLRSLHDLDDENIPTRLADGPSRAPSNPDDGPTNANGLSVAPEARGLHEAKVELAPGIDEPSRDVPLRDRTERLSRDSFRPPQPAAPQPPAAHEVYTPVEVTSPLPPHVQHVQRRTDPADDFPDSGLPSAPRPRRGVGGVVVAAVVLLGLGGMGAYYLKNRLADKPITALDPKAESFLAAGEKALGDGDLDRAKENFDKASVLAEKNPRLLLDYARLGTARADLSWVRQLVTPETEAGPVRAKTIELAKSAVDAADAALAVSPDDPSVTRAKIDGLRAQGQLDKARALVPKVVAQGNQSESAYVLATLDMAGADPVWSTVLQRLRLAASAEGASGRARAALVVALVRSGDSDGARGELTRLEGGSASHPLLGPLKQYVDRAKSNAPAPAATDDAGAQVDVSTLKALNGGNATDPRVLVSQAEIARSHGKLDVAKRLYELALQKNPTDSEALTGLAQVAHAQRDNATAKDAYRRALAQNSSYVPALVGLADVEWESGDRAGAQKSYKDIVDRFPESAYPMRVKVRAEGGGSAPAPSATPSSTATPPPAPSATEPAPTPTPTQAPAPTPKPTEENP